jgi:hypothetical protein
MREMRRSCRQSPRLSSQFGARVRPVAEFPGSRGPPAPDAHIFYDRRVADITDTVPKVSGYWASEAHVTRSLLGGLFGRKRAA